MTCYLAILSKIQTSVESDRKLTKTSVTHHSRPNSWFVGQPLGSEHLTGQGRGSGPLKRGKTGRTNSNSAGTATEEMHGLSVREAIS